MKIQKHHLLPLLIILTLGLLIRLYVWNYLPALASETTQLLVLQLLSFALPLSIFIFFAISILNSCLFYLIGSRHTALTGLFAAGIYSFSPWFIYSDVSRSIFVIGLLGVLLMICGYLRREEKPGYRMLAGGGIVLSYTVLLGFLGYLFIGFAAYRKQRQRLFSLFVPLVPLICLIVYNPEGFKNILISTFSLFADIGIINTINTFQGNLYENGWGGLGKLVMNKFSYYFLLLADSLLRVISPVTYFTEQRRMFNFSNLLPLYSLLLIPFIFGLKDLIEKVRNNVWLIGGFFLLSFTSLFSEKNTQLEKLLLIAPVLVFTIAFGLVRMEKYKTIFMLLSVIFILQILLTFLDFSLYEKLRWELFG